MARISSAKARLSAMVSSEPLFARTWAILSRRSLILKYYHALRRASTKRWHPGHVVGGNAGAFPRVGDPVAREVPRPRVSLAGMSPAKVRQPRLLLPSLVQPRSQLHRLVGGDAARAGPSKTEAFADLLCDLGCGRAPLEAGEDAVRDPAPRLLAHVADQRRVPFERRLDRVLDVAGREHCRQVDARRRHDVAHPLAAVDLL